MCCRPFASQVIFEYAVNCAMGRNSLNICRYRYLRVRSFKIAFGRIVAEENIKLGPFSRVENT